MDMVTTPPLPLPLSTSPPNFFFYSAPTSPRSHPNNPFFEDVYDDDVALLSHNTCTAVPFNWELKPGVPKTTYDHENDRANHTQMHEKDDDFQFDFSGQLDMVVKPSISCADELFDGGKIRPLKLKPPPILQKHHDSLECCTPKGSKSSKTTMSKVKDALIMSPKHRRNMSDFGPDHDPFEVAIQNTRKSHCHSRDEREWKWDFNGDNGGDDANNRGRGRDVNNNMNMDKTGRKNSRAGISRSLSPLRVSEFALLQHQEKENRNEPGCSNGLFGKGSGFGCSKKWRLKDLLLFRSASEGHNKDTQSYSKRWSFRSSSMVSNAGSDSVSGSESRSGSVSKRRGHASSHEMIYTKNRAVSEELKKKTMLPYKHGLLACLGFSPVLPQFSYAFPNTPPS